MADVAGYSRLIGIDDEGTLVQLSAHHVELIEPKVKEHRGRVIRTTGDGLLVLFVSAVDALRCAVDIQRTLAQRNAQVPPDKQINFRMGVNVGDIVEGASIHGDGINVAARLEALAEAGGICVSSRVQEDARGSLGRLGIAFEDIGQHKLKNIHHAVHIYRVLLDNDDRKLTSSFPLPTSPGVPSHESERSAGSVQAVTVLIADMEGFIGLPERLGADTVPLMANYFELISRQVDAHGGMIAERVHDAVVAFWNAPQHAVNACRAAISCQNALGRLTLRDFTGSSLRARIGVSSGSAVIGNVGSSTRPNFSIMG